MAQIAIVTVFAVVYWLTLDTGLQPYELRGGDLITHQYAQVQARPGNAPGYPLYTMGGWLWFHGLRTITGWLTLAPDAPPPNPMPILSSYSTLWALLTLWLMVGLMAEIAGPARARDRLAALWAWLIAAYFGSTYFFWYYATTTEQYSSAVAQTLAILLVYVRWQRNPHDLRRLFFLAFLCGLSLAHMLTVAFIVPPLVTAVLLTAPGLLRSWRAVLGAIAGAALPLLSYLYVWLRGAANPQWWGRSEWASPQAWFWDFIGTAQGREELLWGFEPGRSFFGNGFPHLIADELTLPLLLLGLVGIYRLPRKLPLILYGTLVIYLLFCWAYRYGNWFQVIIPAYPLVLLGLAPVAQALLTALGGVERHKRITQVALVGLLAVALVWRVDASLPAANSRNRAADTALQRAADLLAQVPPYPAALFAPVDDALALDYLISIWGLRPDLAVISSVQADRLLTSGTPVLTTWEIAPTLLDEITSRPALQSISPDWVALNLGAPVVPTDPPLLELTPDIYLQMWTAQPSPLPAIPTANAEVAVDITLTWRLPRGTWPSEPAISLRPLHQGNQLTDPNTEALLQQDRARPIHGLWQDNPDGQPVLVQDSYRFRLPPDTYIDGLLLLLYTQTDDGFANIAEAILPISPLP